MAEKWTKTSAVPPSGVMKPKPFSPLNHFTVPCAMFSPVDVPDRRRKVTNAGLLGRRGPHTPDARWNESAGVRERGNGDCNHHRPYQDRGRKHHTTRSAASTTLVRSIARVIGPTPPG